ncbi:anti-sigma factor RsiW [Phyllobacterium trifolii]|uniref:Anti-sigma factor RsiW n=1 Tax=Phyllobacterium trifolii TaxID=300193 RepID=A0A839UMM3_9HYPH|nr:anti-sigma factor [Phyllobacterium trifolii]MBB3149841.1 anti-sigma factor RsiW [Phyllobacterium trifolii]
MTDSPITEDDLHAYVDGVLNDTRRAEVTAYLEKHPEIADRIQSYSVQRAALRSGFDPIAEEPIPTKLNLRHMIDAPRQNRASSWRAVAAAVVLLFVGGSGGWYMHDMVASPSEGVAALAKEASDSFATYASDTQRPVEVRADNMVQLVDWATERMGRKPILPDLSKSGYRLMGGRVVSTPHGAGLMLMYDNDQGTRLVMLTRPMAVDQNRTMVPHSEGKVDGWTWASNGMGYSLVGSLPSDALHPLANDIRRQGMEPV